MEPPEVEPDVDPKRPAPRHLGVEGRALWNEYMVLQDDGETPLYVFRPDERRYLRTACELSDRLAQVRSNLKARAEARGQVDGDPDLYVTDKTGAPSIDPMVTAERMLSNQISAQLKLIKLPDMDEVNGLASGERTLSDHQRAAVNARWGRHKTATG